MSGVRVQISVQPLGLIGTHVVSFHDEGLLEFRRGRGITVIATPDQAAVVEGARDLVRLPRRRGHRVDELIKVIESVG